MIFHLRGMRLKIFLIKKISHNYYFRAIKDISRLQQCRDTEQTKALPICRELPVQGGR
jgi:hypothetical protein